MQRHHRLGSASQIRRVYATGIRVRAKAATVTGLVDGTGVPAPAKVAVVASKRVGGSVVRNRARRRLREALRAALPAMRPGALVVVAATPDSPRMNFQKLSEDLARSLAKAGLVAPADA